MLHGCAFPDCSTLTLSTYCVEHELLIRALKESQRTHAVHPVEIEVAAHAVLVTADETDAPEPAPL